MPEIDTIADWLRHARQQLGQRLEPELLATRALEKSRGWLYAHGDHALTPEQVSRLDALLSRRQQGEPVAYILGEREFWSRPFMVTPAVLIPRPETETLVATALALPLPTHARVLDLGTGSGCIAITLAAEHPAWRVTAVDNSSEALAVAEENRRALSVENVALLQSRWYSSLTGRRFDLIVSNPPYVAPGDKHLARGDVRFEPNSALVASDHGLADIREIIEHGHNHLNQGGWLVLEHGYDQSEAVRALLVAAGFDEAGAKRDSAGIPRVAFAQKV